MAAAARVDPEPELLGVAQAAVVEEHLAGRARRLEPRLDRARARSDRNPRGAGHLDVVVDAVELRGRVGVTDDRAGRPQGDAVHVVTDVGALVVGRTGVRRRRDLEVVQVDPVGVGLGGREVARCRVAVHDPGPAGGGERAVGGGDLQDAVHGELERRADQLELEPVALVDDQVGLVLQPRQAVAVVGGGALVDVPAGVGLLPAGQVEGAGGGVEPADDADHVAAQVRLHLQGGLHRVVGARRRGVGVLHGVRRLQQVRGAAAHPVGVGEDGVRGAGLVGPGGARRRGVGGQRASGGAGERVLDGDRLRRLAQPPVAQQAGGGVDRGGVADLHHAGARGDGLVADPVGHDVAVLVAGAPDRRVDVRRGRAVRPDGRERTEGAAAPAGQRRGGPLQPLRRDARARVGAGGEADADGAPRGQSVGIADGARAWAGSSR